LDVTGDRRGSLPPLISRQRGGQLEKLMVTAPVRDNRSPRAAPSPRIGHVQTLNVGMLFISFARNCCGLPTGPDDENDNFPALDLAVFNQFLGVMNRRRLGHLRPRKVTMPTSASRRQARRLAS